MQLQSVENFSGFSHLAFCKLGADNEFHDVVVVKANLRLDNGPLEVIPEPAEIHLADHYANPNAPTYSVITRAGDAVVHKPATDVLVTGHAIAPHGEPHAEWLCEFGVETRVGTRVKRLHLTGTRDWQWSGMRGWVLSAPDKIDRLPLTYALAYGGHDTANRMRYDPNPAGCGWFGKRTLSRSERYPAPQIQYVDDPVRAMDTPIGVAGLGPMARWWAGRYRYAGTYDDVWKAEFHASQHSIYPKDFDARFFLCAHPDWRFDPYLLGDESFWLAGFHAESGIRAQLPGIGIEGACLTKAGTLLVAPLAMDTLHIDLDQKTVSLTWRVSLPQSLGITQLALRGMYVKEFEKG